MRNVTATAVHYSFYVHLGVKGRDKRRDKGVTSTHATITGVTNAVTSVTNSVTTVTAAHFVHGSQRFRGVTTSVTSVKNGVTNVTAEDVRA